MSAVYASVRYQLQVSSVVLPSAPSREGTQQIVQCCGQGRQVAVVVGASFHLARQSADVLSPVPPSWRLRLLDDVHDLVVLDGAIDDLDGGQSGLRRAPLLPGSLPAARRAPLRGSASGLDLESPAASTADDLLTGAAHGATSPRHAGLLSRSIGA